MQYSSSKTEASSTGSLRDLRSLDIRGKTVLLRVDLNVPMKHTKIADTTRIERLLPTLRYLEEHDAKIVLLSHFGRPKGTFSLDCSLAPVADALSDIMGHKTVHFATDCIGKPAEEAIASLQAGEILLLENLRFHEGETKNDPAFADALARLGDVYVNDAFSCSHRSHASITGLASRMPSAAGFLLQEEVQHLEQLLLSPEKPVMAIVGGSKVSTKLQVLTALIEKVDTLVVGGAMANTFLLAQGLNIGTSLAEPALVNEARQILALAKQHQCAVILPEDAVTAHQLAEGEKTAIVPVTDIAADQMILDLGPMTIAHCHQLLQTHKTVLWNGPLGAFEIAPFNISTFQLARDIAYLTHKGMIKSIGGGGDVVAALTKSGVIDQFTYISTAGGAFLEWLEGKGLPGLLALQ